MCGILGCAGVDDAASILYEGLERLEYRGYDSAGLAVANGNTLALERVAGRVHQLNIRSLPPATYGIAHTRWATHGPPTKANAHPHQPCDASVAIAHNGIIENHAELRNALETSGHTFTSDTDTEVVAHLLEDTYDGDIVASLDTVKEQLEGTYALLAIHAEEPGVVAATRYRSPLVLGLAEQGNFVASDVVAFRAYTDQVIFLEDGDVARVTRDSYDVTPATPRTIEPQRVDWKLEEATKAGFPHFMLKEIHEQPRSIEEALVGRTNLGTFDIESNDLTLPDLACFDDAVFIACGSSYNAALAASRLFQTHANIATRVELASEYEPLEATAERTLVIAVTQSGETADTLDALRKAQNSGATTLSVTNVVGSTATRQADAWVPIRAGPEISVAATKSFTGQLNVLHLLALHLGHLRRGSSQPKIHEEMEALRHVPTLLRSLLDDTTHLDQIGRWLADHERCFVLGKGQGHAVALESALKIKEISYIHAEGLAAGELKHGPLALIEDGTPVLALAPGGTLMDSMRSSMEEVAARGAHVIALTDTREAFQDSGFETVHAPGEEPSTFPYTATVMGQVIAYYAAIERGTNVDKPRNLAKSVTVE